MVNCDLGHYLYGQGLYTIFQLQCREITFVATIQKILLYHGVTIDVKILIVSTNFQDIRREYQIFLQKLKPFFQIGYQIR